LLGIAAFNTFLYTALHYMTVALFVVLRVRTSQAHSPRGPAFKLKPLAFLYVALPDETVAHLFHRRAVVKSGGFKGCKYNEHKAAQVNAITVGARLLTAVESEGDAVSVNSYFYTVYTCF